MKKLLTSSLLLLTLTALGQAPSVLWEKNYGGTAPDGIFSGAQTADRGYIISGSTFSTDGDISENFGNEDGWIAKLNASGNLVWSRTYGGNNNDHINRILPSGSGYVFAGNTASTNDSFTIQHGEGDFFIAKTEANGDIVWFKLLGGSGLDYATDMVASPDGGFVISGYTQSVDGDIENPLGDNDFWIVKVTATGNIVWKKNLGGSGADNAYRICATVDGGYIVTGSTQSMDGQVTGQHYFEENPMLPDAWVVKLDGDGNLQWQKVLGGYTSDYGFDIKQTTDGGYIIAGASESADGDITAPRGGYDYWVVKLDNAGNLVWQKSLGGNSYDEARNIIETSNGYVVSGFTYSQTNDVSTNYGNGDIWVAGLDTSGNLIWEKNYGGTFTDNVYNMFENSSGEYILCGYTYSADNDVTANHGQSDGWIASLGEITNGNEDNQLQKLTVYPNPATNVLFLGQNNAGQKKYTVSDITGRVINTLTTDEKISVINLSTGIYILENEQGIKTKFIKK